jgi:hypothetical protein
VTFFVFICCNGFFYTLCIVDMLFLDTNDLNPLLSKLNTAEIKELVLRYWSGDDSVTEILNIYGLNCHPRKLVSALPLFITNYQCPYCGQDMVRKILSRASKKKLGRLFCQHCKHSQSSHCACFRCKKRQNTLSKEVLISQARIDLDVKYALQSITDLSLKEALYLLTLSRSAMTISSEGYVGPISYIPSLTPSGDRIVVHHLMKKQLISLSPDTEDSTFIVVDNAAQDSGFNAIQNFDVMAAKWKIHVDEETLLRLKNNMQSAAWPKKWHREVKAIWLEIAVLECAEFLIYLAEERKFDVEITDKLKDTFLALLRHYSVSQCFSVMRHAVREVSDCIIKETISRDEASDFILEFCRQAMKKTYAYPQEARPYIIPQSQLSYVFHFEFLKIGEAGFTTVPHGINTKTK